MVQPIQSLSNGGCFRVQMTMAYCLDTACVISLQRLERWSQPINLWSSWLLIQKPVRFYWIIWKCMAPTASGCLLLLLKAMDQKASLMEVSNGGLMLLLLEAVIQESRTHVHFTPRRQTAALFPSEIPLYIIQTLLACSTANLHRPRPPPILACCCCHWCPVLTTATMTMTMSQRKRFINELRVLDYFNM